MNSRTPREDISLVVPELTQIGNALVQFAETLSGSTDWTQGANYRWTMQPKKFISLQVQRRLKKIRFVVRGRYREFAEFPELKLEPGRGGSRRPLRQRILEMDKASWDSFDATIGSK